MYGQTMNNDVTLSGGEHSLLAGRYQVVRQLGAGGMGSVYLVEDTQLDNKLFAVKMLPSILVANKRAYRQLKGEALVAMKLVHPNIMQIRAFEENNGNPFLVMDYIEGQTLDDYIADKGTLTEEETVRLLKPVASALDYAHGEGVVHRDVKPANVMIRKDGRPFILDFGIAREMQETMTRVTGKFSSGTLLYMSPEQLNGEPPASAQDVYSFAAMVYECLKGEPPFVRGQIEYQILNNPPPPLPDGTLPSLVSAIMRGLAKKPEDRPETCKGILNADRDIKSLTQQVIRTYHEAIKACRDEDCARAFALAQKADKDNAEIQYIIGRCYRYGDGVDEDRIKAMQWYRKAAEQGNVDALYEIGDLYSENTLDPYYEGFDETASDDFIKWLSMALKCESPQARDGFALAYINCVYRHNHPELELETKINEARDLELIRIAAGNGYAEAQYQLGCKYESGSGVAQSYAEAVKWFHKAAEQNSTYYYAQKLGEVYKKGLGVKKDYKEAIKWYLKAVESVNNGENIIHLAEAYELAGKYQEAVTWYRKAAERGIADAQCKLGDMYRLGRGVDRNLDEGIKWYHKAAEQDNAKSQYLLAISLRMASHRWGWFAEAMDWLRKAGKNGYAEAQHKLGDIYAHGDERNEIAVDAVESAKWYGLAEESYRKAAEDGDVAAQCALGLMFYKGEGVVQDFNEALKWINKAALRRNRDAQYYLGNCYSQGLGVKQNYEEAVKWYRKAAERGHADAQNALGSMYKNGIGVTQDYKEAMGWLIKAVEGHCDKACYEIGYMYGNGLGVKQNYKEAARWYEKIKFDPRAAYELGVLYENGWGVDKDCKKAAHLYLIADNADATYRYGCLYHYGRGVNKNDEEAFPAFKDAAEKGHIGALYHLGVMYFWGYGVAQNKEKGLELVRRVAEQGNSEAQDCLGLWYFEGIGVERDYVEAYKWYCKAAEQGEMASQYRLGEMYYSGIGVAKNDTEAAKWFRLLAERNHNSAQYAIGVMYCNGEGVEQNYAEAVKWLDKSAGGGNTDAQYALGVLYENGNGISKDTEKALYWYRKAAERGHEDAAKRLKQISAEVKQQSLQERQDKRMQARSVVTQRKSEHNNNTTPTPSDSQFSTGKRDEYRVNGVDYVDVSGKGFLGTMFSSFFAGLSGKGIVTGWDKMSGTWDEMKRNGK